MKAGNTIAQCAAIPVKIQHHRLFSAWRYVPDDHPLTVSGIERHLLGFREAGHGGQCLQSALNHVS
jgi:hypothetical protein